MLFTQDVCAGPVQRHEVEHIIRIYYPSLKELFKVFNFVAENFVAPSSNEPLQRLMQRQPTLAAGKVNAPYPIF